MSSSQVRYEINQMLREKGLQNEHDVDSIASFLEDLQIPYGHERDIKYHISRALDVAGIPYEVNVKVGPKARVNFLIAGCIALCCYVDATMNRIFNQLEKFAQSNWVDSIIVFTSRNVNIGSGYIWGKPAVVVKPSRTWQT